MNLAGGFLAISEGIHAGAKPDSAAVLGNRLKAEAAPWAGVGSDPPCFEGNSPSPYGWFQWLRHGYLMGNPSIVAPEDPPRHRRRIREILKKLLRNSESFDFFLGDKGNDNVLQPSPPPTPSAAQQQRRVAARVERGRNKLIRAAGGEGGDGEGLGSEEGQLGSYQQWRGGAGRGGGGGAMNGWQQQKQLRLTPTRATTGEGLCLHEGARALHGL